MFVFAITDLMSMSLMISTMCWYRQHKELRINEAASRQLFSHKDFAHVHKLSVMSFIQIKNNKVP